jgi:hypothetical protein
MYNEGKDSCYIDGYNQGLLEGHVDGWDEAKGYYQKIFEKELRETEQLWKEEVGDNEYSEVIAEEYEEPELDGKWSSYSQGRDSKQSESWDWFENLSDNELRDTVTLGSYSTADCEIIVLDV